MAQVVVLGPPITPDRFLAWELLPEAKPEFDGHAPMLLHGEIRIGTAWRNPDASISCTPIEQGFILKPEIGVSVPVYDLYRNVFPHR